MKNNILIIKNALKCELFYYIDNNINIFDENTKNEIIKNVMNNNDLHFEDKEEKIYCINYLYNIYESEARKNANIKKYEQKYYSNNLEDNEKIEDIQKEQAKKEQAKKEVTQAIYSIIKVLFILFFAPIAIFGFFLIACAKDNK